MSEGKPIPNREPTPPKGAASNEAPCVTESSSADAMPAESAVSDSAKATVPHTAATTAAKPRVRTERRAGGDTRNRGQRNYDLAQHDAFSIHPSYIHRPTSNVSVVVEP
jgi:hypothetical protein